MRVRSPLVVIVACACALSVAVVACAQEQPAASAPAAADTAKKAVAPKPKPVPPPVDAVVRSIDAQAAKLAVNKKDPAWRTKLKIPTVATFDPAKSYFARMSTNKGPMLIRLKPDVAPMHVTSFIYLARMGYFDGLKFHRVIKGFMAQGGCPLGTGTGGPGYQFGGEISPKALHNAPGVVSTANAGPGTDGSQFFIMFKAYPSLDGGYTVWGQVEEGLETLKAMEAVANPQDGPPIQPLNITRVTIEVR